MEDYMKKPLLALSLLTLTTAAFADRASSDRLRNCRERVRVLNQENVSLNSTVSSLSSDLQACRIGGSHGDSRRLRRQLEQANQTITLNNETITRLENTIDRKNDKIADLRLQIQDLEDQLNPVPVPNREFTVNGSVEREAFLYQVVDKVQFFDKCVRQFRVIQQADDMSIAINFNNEQILRNSSSYWKGVGNICGKLTQSLNKTRVPSNLTGQITVQGMIEGQLVNIKADSKVGVMNECSRVVRAAGIQQADDINITVNGDRIRNLRNSSSYWKGSEICNEVVKATN
jgi:hypothetical protein